MPNRITIAALLTVLAGLFAGQAHAAPPTDFWINKHFMNMAHMGGAYEAPGNTLYAFKTAPARGADVIEMDGYITADGEFVITHDMEPHKTSNAPYSNYNSGTTPPTLTNPEYFITNQDLADLKVYDFAYKFRPGIGHHGYPHLNPENEGPAEDYIYRGIATGDKPPPPGFEANDFKIPTFEEVLEAMPNTPMTVDMKAPRGDPSIADDAAVEVARIMNEHPERSEDVMIVSFFQDALDIFHELAPNHKAIGGSEEGIVAYVQGEPITPTPVAVQPPDNFNLPPVVDTVPILKPLTDADGYAIQVWPQNGSIDGPELWQKMIDQGANGFFTDDVSGLHELLCETGIPRPDGSLRCPEQECPPHFTGYAPNCQPIPCPEGTSGTQPNCQKICPPGAVLVGDECQCPAGTSGTPPNCLPQVDQKTSVNRVAIAPRNRAIRPGQVVRLRVTVRARLGVGPRVRVNLRSSNRQVRLPKAVVLNLRGQRGKNVVASRVIRVRATRRARGRANITARHGKLTARTVLNVKRPARKARRARR